MRRGGGVTMGSAAAVMTSPQVIAAEWARVSLV